jgi:uncharacterized protein (DUF2062 family)
MDPEPVPTDATPPPTVSFVTRCVHRLAALGETPHRTALSFAVGVFLSFSPFLGFQILMAVGAALALKLSRAALIIGLCSNLPWIMIPWYAATTAAGAAILQLPLTADFNAKMARLLESPIYRRAFWDQTSDVFGPLLWSFLLGSTVGAAVLAVMSYFIMARLLLPTVAHASDLKT